MPPAPAEEKALALALAVDVAQRAEASGRPADRLLREALRETPLTQTAAASAARMLFGWFRWRGLVKDKRPSMATLEEAAQLAARFQLEPAGFDAGALIDAAVPGWLAAHLRITADFVRALQSEPALWLRARPGTAPALAAALPGAQGGLIAALPDAVRYRGAEDLFRTRLFAEGGFEIQDVASQAVGIACSPRPGEKWWDVCAGEGGKTLHLCDLMRNTGVVWSTDRSPARLAVLRRRAARAGLFNYRHATWDGAGALPSRVRFDGVLVDAPCSGVGTWHRNPHARWTTSPADVFELAELQAKLLAAAAEAVKPGGRLVYAVCTLTRNETDDVAERFTQARPDFEPVPVCNPFATASADVPAAAARATWTPQMTGGNGMYVAAWRRTSPRL